MGGCQNYIIEILGTVLGFYGEMEKKIENYYIGVIYTLVLSFWVP